MPKVKLLTSMAGIDFSHRIAEAIGKPVERAVKKSKTEKAVSE
jgi:hypothetical protein